MEPPPVRSATKPPLITPSASPPPRGVYLPQRMADSAPPFKRQRTASTPRRTIQDPSSSSNSRPHTPVDVHKEREASKSRLLDVWASLAERYTRHIEDDDIVDIMTGEITTDNGVLRNARKLEFGGLGGAEDVGTEEEDEEEDEYDLDELDAFEEKEGSDGYELDDEGRPELKAGGKVVPPVTMLNPADAEDLREFMEEEKKRRELCGSDVEEEEVEHDAEEGTEDEGPGGLHDASSEYGADQEYGNDDSEEEQEVVEDEVDIQQSVFTSGYTDHLVPIDLTSEDELDNWDADESCIVRPVLKKEESDVDSEVEFVEPSTSSLPLHQDVTLKPERQASRPRPLQKHPPQLHTPPSSSGPSLTPLDDRFIDLSGDSPPSSPVQPQVPLSKGRSKARPSSNAGPLPYLDHLVDLQPPKANLSQLPLAKAPGRTNTPIRGSSDSVASSLGSRSVATSHLGKPKPYVLLTPRKVLENSKSLSLTNSTNTHQPITEDPHKRTPSPSRKKGKEKAHSENVTGTTKKPGRPRTLERRPHDHVSPSRDESEDPINISSPDTHKTHPTDNSKWDATSHLEGKPSRSDQADSFKSRKRKRVISNSSPMAVETRELEGGALAGEDLKTYHIEASQASTSYSSHHYDEITTKPRRRSSSRRRRSPSESDSHSESGDSSASNDDEHRRRKRSSSRHRTLPQAAHYPYPHSSYAPHHHAGPQAYAPIPDPRAQFIITQAMQQLSALVGAPWPIPPPHYMDGSVPHTPSHRSQSRRPSVIPSFTPTHHEHPYPYGYDPNLSRATLPPDSPEVASSPEKYSSGRRKSLVRRSRSRGRRVSFKFEGEERFDTPDRSSSPPNSSPLKDRPKKPPNEKEGSRLLKGKGKAKEEPEYGDESQEDDTPSRRGRSYSRGQTPGPSSDSLPKKDRR